MNLAKVCALGIATLALVGCTGKQEVVSTKTIDKDREICVFKTDDVQNHVYRTLLSEVSNRGYEARAIPVGATPKGCDTLIKYKSDSTVNTFGDVFVTYLELSVYENGTLVNSALYGEPDSSIFMEIVPVEYKMQELIVSVLP